MEVTDVSIPDKAAISAAINEVLSPTSYAGWVLLGYWDDDTIVFLKSGSGSVDEVVKELKDDEIQFFLVRLPERKEISESSRDIFVKWHGPDVNHIKAGKKAFHDGAVQKLLCPNHAQLIARNRANINEEVLRLKADPLSGSHVID